MITHQEAEVLATQKLYDYVAACGCESTEDLGKALLKFISVAGQALLATQGQEKAVAIVEGTARHLARSEFSDLHRSETLQ